MCRIIGVSRIGRLLRRRAMCSEIPWNNSRSATKRGEEWSWSERKRDGIAVSSQRDYGELFFPATGKRECLSSWRG
jgi:hypothetical protein